MLSGAMVEDDGSDPPDPEGNRRQARVLVALAKKIGASRGDLRATLRQITEAATTTLGVARAGVWLYVEDRRAIVCRDLYEATTGSHTEGTRLYAADNPMYFEALESERAIAADDAQRDPRTAEFTESYLRPSTIGALLDAPIRIRGEMIGVVCNEHIGGPRPWSAYEENLSGTFADLVGLAIEAHEHHQQDLKAQRLESQLRQAQKLESMGLLAGGIAHDFNNLLVGILGNAGLALMEVDGDSPLRPLLVDIRDAATCAAELANEILAYSGRAVVADAAVDLNLVVREMVQLQRRSLPVGSTVTLELDPRVPAVIGDPTQLRRVILNLLTNAADAVARRHGTVTIRTGRVKLPGYDASEHLFGERLGPGEYVTLVVRDDGEGMDRATQEQLFDPFFTTKSRGRGLGMAVVLGIVSGHHGAIKVDSALGLGSTITILLPASAERPAAEVSEHDPERGHRSGTILIADDEVIVRAVTRRVLEREGYRVVEARDGREAIARFHEHRAQLVAVILDRTMPILGGLEVLAAVREVEPELGVLITSGYSDDGEGLDGVDGLRTAFLRKPYNPSALLAALAALGP